MPTNFATLVLITISLAILSTVLLAREWNRRERQIKNLSRRIADLEKANMLRLPHRAADELLDAMAVLDLELDKKKIEFDYLANVKAHITNAMAVGTKRETK